MAKEPKSQRAKKVKTQVLGAPPLDRCAERSSIALSDKRINPSQTKASFVEQIDDDVTAEKCANAGKMFARVSSLTSPLAAGLARVPSLPS